MYVCIHDSQLPLQSQPRTKPPEDTSGRREREEEVEKTFANSHKTAKFVNVSLLTRMKFFVYILFVFRSAKPWERGYTFMAIHI